MTDDRVHIAMCVDAGFALPLSVTLASIDATREAAATTVHVLHSGISEATRDRIASTVENLRLSWIAVDESELRDAFFTVTLSPATLYRLLLDRLLPSEVGRVLYLDADVVVEDSLSDLYATDLDGAILGAVRDANTPWAATSNGSPWRLLGLDPASHYFNAGVLLIDLVEWRKASVGPRCIELLRRESLRWADQDALNGIVRDRWVELPLRWNVQTSELRGDHVGWALWPDEVEAAVANPGIIHFTETQKPWHFGTQHPAAHRWYAWLERTAWQGWTPAEPRDVPGIALARRVLVLLRGLHSKLQVRRALPSEPIR